MSITQTTMNPLGSIDMITQETNMITQGSTTMTIPGTTPISTTDFSQTFYKITNQRELHYGYQYRDGLNILREPFNDKPYDSCCAGGFYFTNAKNIFKFINYGCNVREITLPIMDFGFKVVRDSQGDKWRTNKIIFGEKYDLWSTDTFKMLLEKGADIHADGDYVLRVAVSTGHYEIVKLLIENGADIHVLDDDPLWMASSHGYIDIIKLLVEYGVNPHVSNEYALLLASRAGHLEIVKYLVERGANVNTVYIHTLSALFAAAQTGHFEVVKYLAEKGANISVQNDFTLRLVSGIGYLEIVKYLVEKGANIHVDDDCPVRLAASNEHFEVVKYLVERGARTDKALQLAYDRNHLKMINFLENYEKVEINNS